MRFRILLGLVLTLFIINIAPCQAAVFNSCTPDSGTPKVISQDVTQTLDSISDNKPGYEKEYTWAAGTYPVTCHCTSEGIFTNPYVSAMSDLPSVTHNSQSYLMLNGVSNKLSIAALIGIRNGAQLYAVPFSYISDKMGGVYFADCNETLYNFDVAKSGKYFLYIEKPLVGVVTIPKQTVFRFYAATREGESSIDTSSPIAIGEINGTITVPQSCTINAGQVIQVDFGRIISADLKTKGSEAASAARTQTISMTCDNVENTTTLSISLEGAADPNNTDMLKTSNADVGIKISNQNGTTLPISGEAKLPVNYRDGNGESELTAVPVNTTGKTPEVGHFEALLTLDVNIE
nr:fimbrial protein [uncultured Enterobacter sp.]